MVVYSQVISRGDRGEAADAATSFYQYSLYHNSKTPAASLRPPRETLQEKKYYSTFLINNLTEFIARTTSLTAIINAPYVGP